MKSSALLILAASALSACATNRPAPLVEQGYQRGALGVAAIHRHDWAAAEKALMKMHGVRHDDPARLINLGHVYMETKRRSEALSAWRLALASPRHFLVETVAGEAVSTQELARRALALHDRDIRSAAADPR